MVIDNLYPTWQSLYKVVESQIYWFIRDNWYSQGEGKHGKHINQSLNKYLINSDRNGEMKQHLTKIFAKY